MLTRNFSLAIALGALSAGLIAGPAVAFPSLEGNARDDNASSAASPEAPKAGEAPKAEKPKKEPKKTEPKKSEPKKDKSKDKAKKKLPAQPAVLDKYQIENARIIIGVGKGFGFSDRAIIIALMTAFQESTMYNLDYGDKDSVGLFQQRPRWGWGTEDQILTRAFSTMSFYGVNPKIKNPGLKDIRGWEKMSLNDAAQAVQRSGHPNAYAKWEKLARATLAANADAPKITSPGPIYN